MTADEQRSGGPQQDQHQPPQAESPSPPNSVSNNSTTTNEGSLTIADREPYQTPPETTDPLHEILEEDGTAAELQRIATALSRHQTRPNTSATAAADPTLDPTSRSFDVTKWVRHFVAQLSAQEGFEAPELGVLFRGLDVYGEGRALQVQETVDSVLSAPARALKELFSGRGKGAPAAKGDGRRHILHGFNGVLQSGELLAVLGRPGSGCSTFLKTLCGELHGLSVSDKSAIHYNGTPQRAMKREFKGEVIYNQEVDKHFPHLTVGQTLEFAAAMRTPADRLGDLSRAEYCAYIARVVMAVFGLSHTYHTKVGNDYVRGVSGGERKRVSIAEMMVAGSPLCAWDNSTRGLDSASALRFVQALRLSSDLGRHAHAVAMYQASQAIYDVFDKATVLYDGRQIFFGKARDARGYFERMGWECPARQTTGDFLTAVTNPEERVARAGWEKKVPRTAEEFEKAWLASPEFAELQREMAEFDAEFASGSSQGDGLATLRATKHRRQARHARRASPHMLTIPMQIAHNTKRAYRRIWGDLSATVIQIIANIILGLIIGSIFYGNVAEGTASFDGKGAVLFMAILLNALTAIAEIESLYAQRPIVEKHASYAFYHPATEAAAGIVADVPVKFPAAVVFNLVAYFLAGLRRTPEQFFLFFLVSFITTFVMSAVFRTLAAITKTVAQAMALAGVLVLALIMYTGYIIPVPQMHPWFGWIRWINPIFYAFEILIANEFHGREFICSQLVPPISPPVGHAWVCAVTGAVAGRPTVNGDAYIAAMYQYTYEHVWRNLGILFAFLVGFMVIYLAAVEFNSSTASTAEALVFPRWDIPAYLDPKRQGTSQDEETGSGTEADKTGIPQTVPADPNNGSDNGTTTTARPSTGIEPQTSLFTWHNVVYDIPIKPDTKATLSDGSNTSSSKSTRRLLDHVDGWVKPGTLTALMGASGAGKTTLLDVLAQRTSLGVITGDMLVDGRARGADFQRRTGYVQQQDLHLDTSTVRESLRFSALLRRPPSVPLAEKYAFVEDVIVMLGMQEYANAVVGVPGSGLNVEQRKLLTIGVELVAKPKLLLFLDEPTSGLDSQSAWAICVFLRKLADAGQAVLCTIHQPNALLFQQFDRLLFLAKGGRTVYFGDVGANSGSLLGYFERNGARKCGAEENPAEYMLEIVAEGVNDEGRDWHDVWRGSGEYEEVQRELERMETMGRGTTVKSGEDNDNGGEFAMPLGAQVAAVTKRIFQQYWRMPAYVLPKFGLGIMAGLFIGFTFWKSENDEAGMRNIIFSVFMVTTIFTTLVQQILPLFITQRSLYEVRERPSKTYSWRAFLFANIAVEIPYQIITGILTFASFYYPVVGIQASSRQGLVLLFMIQLFIYASAFAHMTIVALPDAQAAAAIVILLTMMSTIFSGVLQTRTALPGFWSFMYRVSPFTYWISGIVSTALHDRPVDCSATENLVFDPPPGKSCVEYLAPLADQALGTLQNPMDTAACRYCPFKVADQFLAGVDIYWDDRWRNFGIMWAYIVFDVVVAVGLYYLFRVRGVGRMRKN
ncbi:ABC transporter-like protein [Dichotomopilus funicola]|uniref:ABC transporter-like protein n=1 Tax=Dichotomopilus funicola TaxID=1934379 RepID=A0AAN6ZJC3_9PEZI|nr:ABC transporter-like protein [Dichotomopilus funicola]